MVAILGAEPPVERFSTSLLPTVGGDGVKDILYDAQ